MTNWPKIKGFELDQIGGDWNAIAEQTLRQVEKDFAMQGMSIKLESQNDYRAVLENLADILKSMQLLAHPNLAGLLYQLDVNQSEIAKRLHDSDPKLTYEILAESVVMKCFQKVCWRFKMRQ